MKLAPAAHRPVPPPLPHPGRHGELAQRPGRCKPNVEERLKAWYLQGDWGSLSAAQCGEASNGTTLCRSWRRRQRAACFPSPCGRCHYRKNSYACIRRLRLLWAHAGDVPALTAQRLGRLLEQSTNLWWKLSMRFDVASGGRLDPAWRDGRCLRAPSELASMVTYSTPPGPLAVGCSGEWNAGCPACA